jgi:hypothetical protein
MEFYRSFDIWVGPHRFTSPNSETIMLPVPSSSPLPANPSTVNLSNHFWADDRYPYLPFIYQTPFFGPLMDRFSHFDRSSLIHDSAGWHLPSHIAKDWKILEQSFRLTGDGLLRFLQNQFPHLECIWTIPEKPSAYGYFTAHDSEFKAFTAVKDSIRGFVLYSAYLSFLIGLFRCHRRGFVPYTLTTLLQDAPIYPPPDWASQLSDSGIGNFKSGRGRLGAIIDIPQCRWRNLIPFMIQLDIPLWFNWGTKPFADVSGTWAARYGPNPFLREPHEALPTPAVVPPGFPSVVPGSGQRPGEDMEAYFTRRQKENQHRMATETFQARTSRLDRKAKQLTKPCPGKKGPTVFQWNLDNGFRIRHLIPRAQVEGIFSCYASHQMKYDSFCNQYDVCSDFEDGPVRWDEFSDIDEGPEIVDTEMSSQDLRDNDRHPLSTSVDALSLPSQTSPFSQQPLSPLRPPASQPSAPSHLPAPSPFLTLPNEPASSNCCQEFALQTVTDTNETEEGEVQQTVTDTIETVEGEVPQTVTDTIETEKGEVQQTVTDTIEKEKGEVDQTVTDTIMKEAGKVDDEPQPEAQFLEDLVYCRYGFSLDAVFYESPKGIKITIKDQNSVLRSVGGQHLDFSSKKSQLPISDFVNILANATDPFNQVPGVYWDLSSDNYGFLSQQESHFRIEVKDFSNQVLCLLHPRGLESSKCPAWLLAVPPMTALECIRRGFGPDPHPVAEYLATHGMEFRTLQRLPSGLPPTSPGNPSPTPTLGMKPLDHKYDSADFAKYLMIRDSYLENHSHARCALSTGGLIARIARDVLPVSVISMGPSRDALEGKQDVLYCGDEIYVDDALSVEALQLICGTYAQETATRSTSFI